jgi:hypothetical protein
MRVQFLFGRKELSFRIQGSGSRGSGFGVWV